MYRFTLLLIMLAAVPAAAEGIYRYETPDGSIAFTNDPKRVPATAAPPVVVVPSDARWTRVERQAAPHRWYPPQPGYEARQAERHWNAQAEAVRRGIEDAAALEVLADEAAFGRRAARVNAENAARRAERLEEACRTSGTCLPGHLR